MPLRDLVFRLRADDKASATIGRLSGQVQGLSRSIAPLATGVAGVAGLAGVFTAVARGFGSVVSEGREFQRTMSGVKAVTGAVGDSFAKLNEQARQLGASTQFTAVQSAQAMEELGKAGFTVNEIYSVMPQVLDLAAAGVLGMNEAASITADAMRIMGLTVSEFSEATDTLVNVAVNAKTTVSELGFAMQDSAPIAKQMGLSIQNLGALMGILANRGFVATRAGTGLRRVFSVLLGDLDEGEKGLSKFNLTIRDANNRFVGFASVLQQLAEQGADANDILEAFGLRGGPVFLNLLDAGATEIARFNQIVDKMGTTQEIARERMNNLAGEGLKLTSALTEVRLVLFDKIVPALTVVTQKTTDVVRKWGELLKESDVWGGIQKAITAVTLILGVGLAFAIKAAISGVTALSGVLFRAIFLWDKTWIAIARNNSVLKIFTSQAKKAAIFRSTILGAAGAVGFLSFEITRMVLELTGLDGALNKVKQGLADLSLGVASKEMKAASGQVGLLSKRLDGLSKLGIDIKLPEASQTVIEELKTVEDSLPEELTWTAKLKLVALGIAPQSAALSTAVAESIGGERLEFFKENKEEIKRLAELEQAIIKFGERFKTTLEGDESKLKDFQEAMAAAAEEGREGTAQLTRAWELYEKRRAEIQQAILEQNRREKEAMQALEKAIKKLDSAFAASGLATQSIAKQLAEDLKQTQSAAEALGISGAVAFEAFREKINVLGTALQKAGVSGEQLRAFLGEELFQLLQSARTELEFNASINTDAAIAQMQIDFKTANLELPELLTTSQLDQQADAIASALKDATELALAGEITPKGLEDFKEALDEIAQKIIANGREVEGFQAKFEFSELGQRLSDLGVRLDSDVLTRAKELQQVFADVAQDDSLSALEFKQIEASLEKISATVIGELVPNFNKLAKEGLVDIHMLLDLIANEDMAAFSAEIDKANAKLKEIGDGTKTLEESFTVLQDATKFQVTEFFSAIATQAQTVTDLMVEQFTILSDGIASAFSGMIVHGESFGEAMKGVFRGMAAAAIEALIKMGIQMLITNRLRAKIAAKQHAQTMGTIGATTFGHQFSSWSAIPIVGPALAPVMSPIGVAQMFAGSTAAFGTGVAVGTAQATFGQRGAVVEGGIPGRDSVLFALQRKESVLPRKLTEFLLEAAGQPQATSRRERTLVFNISALDATSFRDMLLEDPESLADGLERVVEVGGIN